MGKSPLLAGLVGALRPVGGIALIGGLVLLVLHRIGKAEVEQANSLPRLTPRTPTPTERKVPRDIRDDILSNRSEPVFSVAPTRQAATSWSPRVFRH